jgi:hypothetical protein
LSSWTFKRFYVLELLLPVPQNMGLQAGEIAYFFNPVIYPVRDI